MAVHLWAHVPLDLAGVWNADAEDPGSSLGFSMFFRIPTMDYRIQTAGGMINNKCVKAVGLA